MTRDDGGGGVYRPSRATDAGASPANSALAVHQIEAIFRGNGKSSPIEDYIGQLNTLSQKWSVNAGILQQTVSDRSTPTSMAGLIGSNTGDLKWTGAAASDFGTKATATTAYSDQIAKVMPKIQTALSGLSGNLAKSKTAFQPIFDAWGSPGSGSKASVPHAMSTLLQVSLPAQILMGYSFGDQEQYQSFSFGYGGMTVSANIYVPAKNMHADPGNPYLASTFDLYSPNSNGSGDYGYSGLVWCSYNQATGAELQKYVVFDSADGNNMVTDKDGTAFTTGYLQGQFPQQYKTHLLDLMTITGQHFSTARSQFPALPQPAAPLKPPAGDGNGPTGMPTGGASPTGLGGGGAAGLGGGKVGSPGATGLKQPTMPKTPTGTSTPPSYHLPTATPPATGLPGPGTGGLPGGTSGLPGGDTGLPDPSGGSNGGYPTGLPNVGSGTPGYTSTQTAGYDPTSLPSLASGLPGTGLGGGLGPGATGLAGGTNGLGGLGGLGALAGLGATPGALGGYGGGAPTTGSVGLGTTASGAPLAAGETAAAQGALGEQTALAEAGAAGRMPMMPPMAPMGMNNGNGDRNRKSWLPEEEDLWGLAESSAAPPVIGSEP